MMISESDKLSVGYRAKTKREVEHYSWMFKEDFSRNIIPASRSQGKSIKCFLDPDNKSFEKLLYDILPSSHGKYRFDFNDIILDTIQYIGNQLVHNGFVIFEFVKLKDINGIELFKLERISGSEIKIENGNIVQIISQDEAEPFQDGTEQIDYSKPVVIPKDKCFIIDFPEILGGKEGYLKFIEEFKSLGTQSPMMNYFNNSLSGHVGYDMTEHQRLHELELWKKSKTYSWHHRSNNSKEFSGYYYIYRYLNFISLKTKLRDYIVEQLKKIVSDLSERLGEKEVLNIEGLIPLNEVDKKLEQWSSGEMNPNSLNEVLK